MPKKKKKDRPLFKGRSHKSFLNQCRLKLVTLGNTLFFNAKNRLESNKIRQKLTALKKGYASASLIMRKF